MNNKGRFTAAVALALLAACGGSSSELSGTYEGRAEGAGIRIEFKADRKARVTLFNPDGEGELSHNTVYTVDGKQLHFTTDEPLGAPMDLVYDGGVLSDGSGMVFEKK